MTIAQFCALTGCVELLSGERANRLEHPVTLVGEVQQALLDEGLHRVEVGAHHFRRSDKRAATAADGQCAKEPLLLVGDLTYERSVNSLAELLERASGVRLRFVSPDTLRMRPSIA